MYFFFFNDTATTEIYTLSLHDALPIWRASAGPAALRKARSRSWCLHSSAARGGGASTAGRDALRRGPSCPLPGAGDRKSTRLNSSHANISYAVFCLKKKKNVHNLCKRS